MTFSIMASSYVSNELLFKMRLFQTIFLQELQHNFFFYMYIFIYLAALDLSWGTWDFQLQHVKSSSLTRDQTWFPALGAQSLSHWTTREVPLTLFSLF